MMSQKTTKNTATVLRRMRRTGLSALESRPGGVPPSFMGLTE